MKNIKKYIFITGLFLILNIIITLLSYFDIFNNKFINILKIITFILISILLGIISYKPKKKYYITGIKTSVILIIILLLISFIIPGLELTIKSLLYFIIMTLLITLGNLIEYKKRKHN